MNLEKHLKMENNNLEIIKLAEKLAKNLSLSKIHMREASCTRTLERVDPSKNEISIGVKSGLLEPDKENILPFNVVFTVKATEKDSGQDTFQVEVEFCVIYQSKEGVKPQDNELEAFGITNVVFNAWPYAREYVQNTLTRMDLPPFVMPLLKISDLLQSHTKTNNETLS